MASEPKISQWSWLNIDRRREYSKTQAGEDFFRENWTVTRSRVSNKVFTSELGDTAGSLSAYNGGVTETVTAPTYDFFSFTSMVSATDWFAELEDVPFYPAGYNRGGKPVYILSEQSPRDTTKACVLFYEYQAKPYSGINTYWQVGQCSSAEATSGTFAKSAVMFAASDLLAANRIDYPTPTGPTYRRAAGAESGTGAITSTASTENFRCVSDLQSYSQQGVEWYTQTQTWIAKSPWS